MCKLSCSPVSSLCFSQRNYLCSITVRGLYIDSSASPAKEVFISVLRPLVINISRIYLHVICLMLFAPLSSSFHMPIQLLRRYFVSLFGKWGIPIYSPSGCQSFGLINMSKSENVGRLGESNPQSRYFIYVVSVWTGFRGRIILKRGFPEP